MTLLYRLRFVKKVLLVRRLLYIYPISADIQLTRFSKNDDMFNDRISELKIV